MKPMKHMKQTCLMRKRKDITAMARDARALELTTDSHDAVSAPGARKAGFRFPGAAI